MLRQRLKELEGALADLSYEGEPSSKISSHLLSVLAQCDRSSFILSGHSFWRRHLRPRRTGTRRIGAPSPPLRSALRYVGWCNVRKEPAAGCAAAAAVGGERAMAVGKWGVEQLNCEHALRFLRPFHRAPVLFRFFAFFPTCIARKTRSLGPNERRHKLHRAVACVADAFATRARQQHNNPMDSVVLSSQMLFSTPEASSPRCAARTWRVC